MDNILRGIPCIFIYLDDILASSNTRTEHADHLRQVFKALSLSDMVVQRQKCVFSVAEIDFLGHHITTSGIKPLPERVPEVREFPVPNTKKSLQMFLGMVTLYHRFLPGLAGHLHPLHEACKGRGKAITWSDDCQIAFDTAKSALASAAFLEHPTNGCKLAITVDASNFTVGGSLDQFRDGFWHPLAFFSEKLTTAEWKYATFDRELLALYLGIKQFCHYVEARPFTAFTDHMPHVGAMTNAVDRSPRQQDISLLWQSSQMLYNTCQVETMWSQMPCPEPLPLLQCSLQKLIIDNLLLTKLPRTRSTRITQQSWASS